MTEYRSEWHGIVRFENGEYDNNEALGSMFARATHSNIAHQCDSCGQVLVQMAPRAASNVTFTVPSSTEWTLIWRSAALQIRTIPSRSYVVRARVRAAVSSAVSTTTAVVLHPAGFDARSYADTSFFSYAVETYSHSSTTPGWLTPTGDGLLHLTRPDLSSCVARDSDYSIADSQSLSVDLYRARISVLARASSAPDYTLYGLYAAEVIGT